ncbi:restriction endonuclease subunit S [Acinetobacter sp. NigerLNRRAM0016]
MAVPKLRFKEFDGDWERMKLSQMGTFKNGINKDKEDFGHGVPFINLMDVFGKNSICQNTFDLVNANSKEIEAYSLKQGDVLFIRSSVKPEGVAETAVVLEDLDNTVYSGFLIRYRPSKDIDLHYKKYCFSTDFFRKNVLALSTTSANTNINQESLSLLNLDLPSKPEQTKIASFLSNVDEKISQLTQKHELLSQYKQGMMQKLFSQQIRFKADDGCEFGEWVNSYIGNECKITTGNKDTQNKVDDGLYPFFVRSQTVEKINSYSMDCEAILTSGDGVGVGKNYHYINGKFDFHQRVYCLYEFSERLVGRYLYIYFSNYFYDRVKRLSAKNSVDSVRMDMISKMEIKLPCLEEQTKIANFLSAIDQKIEVVAQQIEQAKTWKKGLLQQMFV